MGCKVALIDNPNRNAKAQLLCEEFINTRSHNRYVFGINEYASEIAKSIDIAGFIDDFTTEVTFLNKPIVKSANIPADAIVVSSLLGRPLTARELMKRLNIKNIDFFSFYSYSGLLLHPVRFWGDGKSDIEEHLDEYTKIYEYLSDQDSKDIFRRIVNFRVSSNIEYLNGFCDRQKEQYFEPFINFKKQNEVFVDVGGFEGETSQEFIRRCPDYKEIFFLEPDNKNMQIARLALQGHENIHYLQYGASNRASVARFTSSGSVSSINEDGNQDVQLNRIDDLVDSDVSYIKMDIEGVEMEAIEGAVEIISRYQPVLAIAVYHHSSDLRTIPRRILEICNNYKIYIRHYTEGVVETIMYFIPTTK
jgi:FkbM family methyltransferase